MHHYVFAHRMLPELLLRAPMAKDSVPFLCGPDAAWFLAHLWRSLGEKLPETERLAGDGLAARSHDAGDGRTVVVVTLPPTVASPEAHFVAVVTNPGKGEVTRYLTLEHSIDIETRKPITVLGEWTADGSHVNMGRGPEPEEAKFLESVLGMLGR